MRINPEYINELVNFNDTTQAWRYDPNGLDMRSLQVKGSARIFNLLQENNIALLADEVGMGKTLQSLTVCAALWQQKPDARIYIITPRDEIARNWIKEYQTFIKRHYRHEDNIVKTSYGQQPIHEMVYCQNLYELINEMQSGTANLIIGKVSSYSTLHARKDVGSWLNKLGIKESNRLKYQLNPQTLEYHNEIVRVLKLEVLRLQETRKSFFDLLIIDEAHYLRNRNGKSLRVGAASIFFGDPHLENSIPLAQRVLLMTATPNHSSSSDIGNIVRYFTKRYDDSSYKQILDEICVRRLRRLASGGKNKYNYREEIDSPSDFRNNPLSELFFAIYQQMLVKALCERQEGKSHHKWSNSRMMKYLEGVEFLPEGQEQTPADKNGGSETDSDYHKGADTMILSEISKDFLESFGYLPPHPKYNKLVEDLIAQHEDRKKKVVFVRRIPSVFEISRRIIEHYDRQFWTRINPFIPGLELGKLTRQSFNRHAMLDHPDSEKGEEIVDSASEVDERNIPVSKVLNLFKVVKNINPKSTKASNFRLRFAHSKTGPFTIFFSPGSDYGSNPYYTLPVYKFGTTREENYYLSGVLARGRNTSSELSRELETLVISKPISQDDVPDIKAGPIHTLFTLFWQALEEDHAITPAEKTRIRRTYETYDIFEKEALSNFVEKGALLASEAIVEFFAVFLSIEGEALDLYQKFTNEVRRRLRGMRLYSQITDSILHFGVIYAKVFTIRSYEELLKETWDQFGNAQPIYPYNADNTNHKVLNCFNTPFYPDLLVATSVLQEGVNLQYFCDTIYHYGMAWTPGDNEQRIGRIDRMFGKIERELESDNNARLKIYYPYLKDTIDEEHLARFVRKKYREELLIDMGKSFSERDINLQDDSNPESWKIFLRKPEKNAMDDPFPVTKDHFKGIDIRFRPRQIPPLNEFFHSISNAIKSIDQLAVEIHSLQHEEGRKLLVNPHLTNGRKQPVFIELAYDPIGRSQIGQIVYCLVMKTPLHTLNQYRLIQDHFDDPEILRHYRPGVKLCLNKSEILGSNWGIYLQAELPLFITEIPKNPLSISEIQHSFLNLVNCADLIEFKIFGNRDLTLESLNIKAAEQIETGMHRFRTGGTSLTDHEWKLSGNHLLRNFPFEFINQLNEFKSSLIINHQYRYIKCYHTGKSWTIQVAHLHADAQHEELALIEKHAASSISRLKITEKMII